MAQVAPPDKDAAAAILSSGNQPAQIALLAVAARTKTTKTPKQTDGSDTLRYLARYHARFSWRSLKGKDATSIVPAPNGYSILDATRFPLDHEDTARRDERQMQTIGADSILIARNFDGLWKQVAGTKAVRISGENSAYMNPVVTPDGKWVVVSRSDGGWGEPNYLVRLNLETGQESRVNVEPADQLDAIAFLPVHNKILVRRARDDGEWSSGKPVGPGVPEHYLIDPRTGELQSVSSEFTPLLEEGKRFLQPRMKRVNTGPLFLTEQKTKQWSVATT